MVRRLRSEMKNKRILVCDGSLDGIFTAIYKAYDMRYGHEYIKIMEKSLDGFGMNYELFSEYIEIETDYELSAKVARSIKQKISYEVYEMTARAALSQMQGRSDVIYRFLILGFRMGKDVVHHLSNDAVSQIFVLNRNVGNEAHHFTGFLRFREVADGVLLSTIKPKNHILSILVVHFADRLNGEDFIIYDEGRGIAAIHPKNSEAFLMEIKEEMIEALNAKKSKEEEYVLLWKAFYESISIKERENKKLQRNNLPLRFRGNMTEFQ